MAGIGSAGADGADEPAQAFEGQRSHAIMPPEQGGPDQPVGLRVSAAPPALAQVGADPLSVGCVELVIDIGKDLRTQSQVPEMTHGRGTRRPSSVIPAPEGIPGCGRRVPLP